MFSITILLTQHIFYIVNSTEICTYTYTYTYTYTHIVPINPLEIKPQIIFPTTGKEKEVKKYDGRCIHYASGTAWQTTGTWYQMIKSIAAIIAEGIEGPHVILIDSYRVHFAHPTLCDELANNLDVHLYPVVINATQFCQPMDQFVIPSWK